MGHPFEDFLKGLWHQSEHSHLRFPFWLVSVMGETSRRPGELGVELSHPLSAERESVDAVDGLLEPADVRPRDGREVRPLRIPPVDEAVAVLDQALLPRGVGAGVVDGPPSSFPSSSSRGPSPISPSSATRRNHPSEVTHYILHFSRF